MYLPNNTLLQGGKYKIVRHISSGGFGNTYEGIHTMLDTRVAIKEFFVKDYCNRDENTSHVTIATQNKRELVEKLRKKFNEEAKSVFKMKHENIVRVIDVFEENSTAYYVMDYIEGISLHEIMKQHGPLSETEAVGYIRQIADALKYVHSLNRLHLDIKPGNIMVDASGRALLIDFGASKHYDDETGENTSTLLGVNTVGYAPVEQSTQSFTSFSPATDIYALGATLYKLLTGITPPDAALLMAEEAELAPLPPTISPAVRNTVMKAMEVRRKNRLQSIDEFLALLDGKTADSSEETQVEDSDTVKVVAVNPQPDPQPTPKPKSNKNPLIAVCIAVVCALTVCFFFWNTGDGDNSETTTIPQPAQQSPEPQPAQQSPEPQQQKTRNANGHDYVDLGLSVKWATCNVGAYSPEGYGSYFAWGETSTKSEYIETYEKDMSWLRSNGYLDSRGNLTMAHDAVRQNWGGSWRMPTKAELQELNDNCTWTWTTRGGKNGYEVKSKKNGNLIFLPATGCLYGGALYYEGKYGFYWSSTPKVSDSQNAWYLSFLSSGRYVGSYSRYGSQVVRGVIE